MSTEIFDRVQLHRQLAGLTKLLDLTIALASHPDLDTILRLVTDGACEAHDCERASLFLLDEDRGDLFTKFVTELEIKEIRREFGESIVGFVAERREIVNIPDPHADNRWDSSIDERTGFLTQNILAAPILSIHDGKLLGVLQLLNKREGEFDACDERLIQAFATHAGTAIERNLLLEEARHSQELELELGLGRNIQSSFLPKVLPQIPGYELASWWEPAESVSGDYFDLIRLPDNRLGIMIADVSGHGVGPSLIMASFRAMFRVLARERARPSRLMTKLAETIYPDLTEGRFITALFAAVCPATHEFTFANAAHAPVLYLDRARGLCTLLETTSMPIGAVPDLEVPAGRLRRIAPGDAIVFATDGIIELRDEQGEMYGLERLQQLILDHQHLPAGQMRDLIRREILHFHPRKHPPDDITLLILERKRK